MDFLTFFQAILFDSGELIDRLSTRITGIFDSSSSYGQLLGGCAVLLTLGVSVTIVIFAIRGIRSLVWDE